MTKRTKKRLKIGAYIVGGLAILYMLGSLGINYWLRHNLPDLINKESPYRISYKSIDVVLATRSITLDSVTIEGKTPEDSTQIQINGKVNKIRVSQLGIRDAIFNKIIHSGEVALINPDLKIRLAKPTKDSTSQNEKISFDNIKIANGKVDISRYTEDPMLSVENLNLKVTEFKLTEKGVKQKLPVVFDDYNITGDNFVYTESDAYQVKVRRISTNNKQISIHGFQLAPLLSPKEFAAKYPDRTYLFEVHAEEATFKDIVFQENTLALSQIKLTKPKVKVISTGNESTSAKKEEKSNSAGNFDFNVSLQNATLVKGMVEMEDVHGKSLMKLGRLDAEINKFAINEETSKKQIPFKYESYKFDAYDIHYTPAKTNASIASIKINDKNMTLRDIQYSSTQSGGRNVMKIPLMELRNYSYDARNGKGFLAADSLNVQNVYGVINVSTFDKKKSSGKSVSHETGNTQLDMKLGHFQLNGSIVLNKKNGSQLLKLNQLKASMNKMEFNEQTAKQAIPLKYANFRVETRNFNYIPNNYSKISIASIVATDKQVSLRNFNFVPTKTRAQFLASLKKQEDLYTVKVPQIDLIGYHYTDPNGKPQVVVDNLNIHQFDMNLYSYNGNHPPPDNVPRNFFNDKLRNVKFPLFIKNTKITDSKLVYEESDDDALAPGKLNFSNMNVNVENLNTGKIKGLPTLIKIHATTDFLKTSPTRVFWTFDVADKTDGFTFNADIKDIDASQINDFIKPYLHVSASGYISNVNFKFKGNHSGIHGPFAMTNKDLKVELLKKDTNEKKGFLSMLANWLVKSNSGADGQEFMIDHPRDEKRSFFNLLWKGMEDGLRKGVLGEGTDKTMRSATDAVEDFNTVFGSENKPAKKEKPKVAPKKKEEDKKEKKGFFRRIFGKKES